METPLDPVRRHGRYLFGPPPAADAPLSDRLRFVRRCLTAPLPVLIPFIATVTISTARLWIYVAAALITALWIQGIVTLTMQIRRARRRERS